MQGDELAIEIGCFHHVPIDQDDAAHAQSGDGFGGTSSDASKTDDGDGRAGQGKMGLWANLINQTGKGHADTSFVQKWLRPVAIIVCFGGAG
jgi:hypothetical protein